MSAALKHGYRIIVLCRVDHCAAVEQIVREHLDAARLAIDELGHQMDSYDRLACIVARVYCATAERSTLVRLISRLGQDPSIRSVRWENLSDEESS